jgi:Protein O-mannosyl-transferase TMEM260-like
VRSSPASAQAADASGRTLRRAILPAVLIGLAALGLYRATLLPDFDFGDTGYLQTTVGSPVITPRAGYPLYFAIASAFVRMTGTTPARAVNLASAVQAAIACALVVLVGAELSGSVLAASAAAVLLAASYTFWSQAIIAEVYALHMVCVALALLLLLRWAERPTMTRLGCFFAAYALGFGNHLAMILLAPAFTLFLLAAAPGGFRSMLRPRVVGLAVACAAAGALQYGGTFHALWLTGQPPASLAEGLQRFWFDITKSDWRDTLVMSVPRAMLADHFAMYWFDLRQQFGVEGPALAVAGLVYLAATDRRRAILMFMLYAVNVAFAFSYNVGDAHVFYMPSHLVVALLAACGVALAGRFSSRAGLIAAVVLTAYAVGRAYADFPALDRSGDRRPAAVMSGLTHGLDDRHSILLSDLNWQLVNGLAYFSKIVRPEIAQTAMAGVLLYAPALVADNHAVGREVTLTDRAAAMVTAAYGPLLPVDPDPQVPVTTLTDAVRDLPSGTRYVLCVLKPSRDFAVDAVDLASTLRALTAERMSTVAQSDYAAIAGRVGEPPQYIAAARRPFRRTVQISGVSVEIRMESWLASDTIRRMGFGHVIAARRHTLIVERGVSFVAFDDRGQPSRTVYAANIFAPQPRFIVRR